VGGDVSLRPSAAGLSSSRSEGMAGTEGPRLAGKGRCCPGCSLVCTGSRMGPCGVHGFLGSLFLPAAPPQMVVWALRAGGDLCLALVAQGITAGVQGGM